VGCAAGGAKSRMTQETVSEGLAGALEVREPREAELPLCRVLLPDAAADSTGRQFRLAFSHPAITPVAALSYRDNTVELGGIRIHVVPPFRRMHVGSRLLEYTEFLGRQLGRTTMSAVADLPAEPAAEPFLLSRGFRRLGTVTFAEIGIAEIRAAMAPYRHNTASKMRLPENSRFVGLNEAPRQQIANLYAEHIAHLQAVAGLQSFLKLEHAVDSIALLVGDTLAAFVLARVDEGVLHIPAWVVAPQFRGHQIGAVLLLQLAARLQGRVSRMRFEFTEEAVVTAKVLTVPGCVVTRIAARFEKALT